MFFFVDYQFTKFQVVFQKKKSIDVIPKCIHCNFNPLKYNNDLFLKYVDVQHIIVVHF